MVIYIEDSQAFNNFVLGFNSYPSRIYIQLSDTDKHALNNRISFIVVRNLKINDYYVINLNHTDGLSLRDDALKLLEESQRSKAVINCKSVTHLIDLKQAVDIDLYRFIASGETNEDLFKELQSFYKRSTPQLYQNNLNDSIPLAKQVGIVKDILSYDLGPNGNENIINFVKDATEVFQWVEKSGIFVDEKMRSLLPSKHINKDGLVFTEYNLFTSTLRPSNRHGGINYSAIPKKSDMRKAFVSRFKDGKMVSIDYSAYHPHLIMELIEKYDIHTDWQRPKYGVDFYDWVSAKLGIADLDGAREEAKKLVFQSMYGGVSVEMQGLPFFNEVHLLALKYKADLDRNGFVLTPVNHVPITKEKFGEDNPPPAKVLNYVIQAFETERNIQILKQLKYNYKGLGKLIMYNYDAFVFDVPNYEITYLYEEIYEKIIDSKEFPATIVTGENYDFR
jgi:hypothetical protein